MLNRAPGAALSLIESLASLARSSLLYGEDLLAAFRHLTEVVGEALEVERIGLWLFDDGRRELRCVDLYERSRARHSAGIVLEVAEYPTYFEALEQCEAMVADDVTADPRTREFAATYTGPLNITAMMDVPLHLRGQLVGVVCHEQVGPPRPWAPEDRLFALAATHLAALALEHAARREADRLLVRQNEYLAALNDTTLGLLEQQDRTSLLESIVARAGALMATPHGFLYAVDPEAGELVERVATGIFEGLLGLRLRRGQGVVGKVWETGQPLAAPDAGERGGEENGGVPLPAGAMAAVPLRVRGEIVGVLGLSYLISGQSFGGEELSQLSRFGELASLVLEIARLHEELEMRVAERTAELAAANASLRASEARLQRVAHEWQTSLDAVDSVMVLVDRDATVRRLNRAARDLLRRDFSEVIGRPFEGLAQGEPWRSAQQVARRLRATGQPSSTQGLDRESGRTWDVAASPVTGGEGGSIVILARDVTHIVSLQQSLRRSETLSAMGSLVAGVAHEVRNPLFAISASLDAMEQEFGADSIFQDYGPHLRSELARLNQLMHDLLDYGRPTSPEQVPGSLSEVIARAITFCLPQAGAAGVALEARVAADLPTLPMDRERLVQVFQNLIQNAIQHCSQGGVVTVAAREVRDGGIGRLRCTVEDTGRGFCPDDLGRVFEPFFTRRRGGTGLGLSIAHRIVEEHGGTLAAGNRPGGGAILTVTLPCAADRGGG
jgi:PAS domain S-box-containing protein